MKKKILSLTLIFLMCFSLVVFATNTAPKKQSADYSAFANSLVSVTQNDNFETIEVSKNASTEEAINIISNSSIAGDVFNGSNEITSNEIASNEANSTNSNNVEGFSSANSYNFSHSGDNIVTKNSLTNLGFVVSETDENYVLQSKFALKRLIVKGKVSNTFGATNVVSGYKGYSVLCYDSESATKSAYENLLKNDNLSVSVDTVFSSNSYADSDYDYSSNVTAWGAKAVDYAGYEDYLVNNLLASKPQKDVVVVVIDSGINTAHSMFAGRLVTDSQGNLVGKSYYPSLKTYSGYDFEDDDSHGTHVSGIIVDNTPSFVKILPIKALNHNGSGSMSSILGAISYVETYADDYNIACVNMSFGGSTYDNVLLETCTELFDSMRAKGIMPVVAAGNDAEKTEHYLPATCENALVVSALKAEDASGKVISIDIAYSNYGEQIDISAPGTDINSATLNGSNYEYKQGTSMAAPFVSAGVALMFTHYTNLPEFSGFSAEFTLSIENRLKELAIDLGDPGYDTYYGHGLINLKYFEVAKSSETISIFNASNNNPIEITSKGVPFSGSISVDLTCSDPSYKIYYTTDGSIPNKKSDIFSNSIKFEKKSNLKFIGIKFDNGGQISSITDVYDVVFVTTSSVPTHDFAFDNRGSYYYLLAYRGSSKNVTIPKYYPNTTTIIKGIAENAFYGNKYIESVTIPDTCTDIEKSAFYHCCHLESVTANGVEIIGASAFYNCHSLKFIDAQKAKVVGDKAFYGTALQQINSEEDGEVSANNVGSFEASEIAVSNFNSLVTAGKYAFADIDTLSSVYLDNLTTIGNYGFYSCNNLKSASLDSILQVSSFLFNGCLSLESFEISKTVTSVGPSAFNKTKLPEFVIDNENKNLYTDGHGLYYKNNLVAFTPHNNFSYSILEQVTINGTSYTIDSIYDETFADSTINYIKIPKTIVNIGRYVFAYSTIDIFDYDAASAVNTYYLVNGVIYEPFYYTTIEICNINSNVESTPAHLFYGSKIDTININKYQIAYDTYTFNLAEVKTIFLNFTDNFSFSGYFGSTASQYKLGTLILDKADYIYTKNNFNSSASFSLTGEDADGNKTTKTFYYNGKSDTYHLYATSSSAIPKILFETTNYHGVYDGQYHIFDIEIKSNTTPTILYGFDRDSCTITDITKFNEFKNATDGELKIHFILKSFGYSDTYGFAYIQIDKVKLVFDINDVSDAVYGEVPNTDSFTYNLTSGAFVSGEEFELNISTNATKTSRLGDYTISGEVEENEFDFNYDIVINNGTYTINRRPITITVDNITKYYGEFELTHKDYEVTSTYKVVNNDNLNIRLIYSNNEVYGTNVFNAGEYDVTLAYTNNNYFVTVIPGTLNILKRDISYTIKTDFSSVYGDELALTKDGSYFKLTNNTHYTMTGSFIGSDEQACEFKALANFTKYSDVAEYDVIGHYNSSYIDTNYNINITNGKYTITKRDVSIEIESEESEYFRDIKLTNNHYKVTSGSFVLEDENLLSMVISTTATSASNAGEYDISYAHNTMTNYNVTVVNNAKYTVTKRNVTFNINNASSYYGEEIVLNGYTIQGEFAGTDESLCGFSFGTSVVQNDDVGDYDIVGQFNESAMATNYNITINSGKYSVVQREITITLDDSTSTYGDVIVLSGTGYKITSTKDFVGNDKNLLVIDISTDATNRSDAGDDYVITATTNKLKNYKISIVDGKYTITKRKIEVNLNNQSSAYGNAISFDNTFTSVDNNIIFGDDIQMQMQANIDSTSPVGEYEVTGVALNPNYDCKVNPAIYTITKRKVTVKILDQKTPHFGELKLNQTDYSFTSGEVVNGDTLNIKLKTDFDRYMTFWGEIEIYGEFSNSNYDVTFENGILTVEVSNYDFIALGIVCAVIFFLFSVIVLANGSKKNKKKSKSKKKGSSKGKSSGKGSGKSNEATGGKSNGNSSNSNPDTPVTYV